MRKNNTTLWFGAFLIVLITALAFVSESPAPVRAAPAAGLVEGPFAQVRTPPPGEEPRFTATPTATQEPRVTQTPVPTSTWDPGMTATPTDAANPRFTPTPADSEGMIPLMDMVNGESYLGFEGGLYPGGTNQMPTAHFAMGLERAGQIQPLDVYGNPSQDGKIVLLVVGMSNTEKEACGSDQWEKSCPPYTFVGRANEDPAVNHRSLFIFDGAHASADAEHWVGEDQYIYDWIDMNLGKLGLSSLQVQAVWVKQANGGPTTSLPSEMADAYDLMEFEGGIVRTLMLQYPNLQQIFFSSRIYAGYSTEPLNPEPYAYESGFAVKWLIEAQIDQMASGGGLIDPVAGDLNYNTVAPWLAWGPYLWANGTQPRSDGLTYVVEDFKEDMTHPSISGAAKVGQLLLDFFKASPHTQCWFLAGQVCE